MSVVIEARGGTAGSAGARNTAYAAGFELLLRRLKAARARIKDAVVDSRARIIGASEAVRRSDRPRGRLEPLLYLCTCGLA